ncbi:MAG: hypothetical protein SF069_02920 [Phycisphaerae bacterium]|nr:hypothetical protein [Phycisphaerae bacterium]
MRLAVSGLVPCQGLIATRQGCNQGAFPTRYRGELWQATSGAPLNGVFTLPARFPNVGRYWMGGVGIGSSLVRRFPSTVTNDCDCVDVPTNSLSYTDQGWFVSIDPINQPGNPPACRMLVNVNWAPPPGAGAITWTWMATGLTSTLATDFVAVEFQGGDYRPPAAVGCYAACGPLQSRGHQAGAAFSVEVIP